MKIWQKTFNKNQPKTTTVEQQGQGKIKKRKSDTCGNVFFVNDPMP